MSCMKVLLTLTCPHRGKDSDSVGDTIGEEFSLSIDIINAIQNIVWRAREETISLITAERNENEEWSGVVYRNISA